MRLEQRLSRRYPLRTFKACDLTDAQRRPPAKNAGMELQARISQRTRPKTPRSPSLIGSPVSGVLGP
jgi:hypothetical protein